MRIQSVSSRVRALCMRWSRTNKQSNAASGSGFTIIEVLIVLAIAGLILLIVFEAIPALQRSSRNNQRRQDVGAILDAVSHYELNNSGTFPDCGYGVFPAVPHCFGVIAGIPDLLAYAKLTFYTTEGQVVIQSQGSSGSTPTPTRDTDTVYVYNYQKCSSTAQGSSTGAGAGYNDVVALYSTESGVGPGSVQCQQQ